MDCPSEEDLLALVEGRMAEVAPDLEAHLDACATCRELIVAAASLAPEVEVDATGPSADERYELRGEVGRGGQSRVLRAFDRHMGREIALKVFAERGEGSGSGGPTAADRCVREVRTTGALSHPAILPVHEMGVRPGGSSFYSMPLVDGPTLAAVVAETPTVAARIRLLPHVVQVCQAVAYAHSRGFVHRDIKPENIMVGAFGETLLLDWGLARIPSGDELEPLPDDPVEHDATLDGAVLGTPAYMSPEQAEGRQGDVGPSSDVWSLGAVLFFVLSGRAPFEGRDTAALLDRVRRGDPQPLRADDGEIPPELAAVVHRAMAKDRQDRYATASELADDLIAFQSGARVSAYAYAAWERAMRFARRYRTLLVATMTILATLATGLVVVALSYRREVRARTRTAAALVETAQARNEAELSAEAQRRQATQASHHLALAHVEKAERMRADRRPLQSRRFAASALRNNPSHAGSPVFDAEAGARFPGGRITTARALGLLALGGLDEVGGVTRTRDTPRSGSIREVDGGGPRCPWVAIADGSGVARVTSIVDDTEVARLPGHGEGVVEVNLSPTGKFAVTRDGAGTVRRWTLPAGESDGSWPGGIEGLLTATVSDAGAIIFVDGAGGLRWVAASSRETRPLAQGPVGASTIRFSHSGRRIAVGTETGEVIFFDLERAAEVGRDRSHSLLISDLAWSSDDTSLAVAAVDGRVVVLDAGSLAPRGELSGHGGFVTSIAFSVDGRRLYTAASDGRVRGFDLESWRLVFELDAPLGHLYEVQVEEHELIAWGGARVRTWALRKPGADVRIPKGRDARNTAAVQRGDRQWMPTTGTPSLVWVDWAQATSGRVELAAPSPVARAIPLRDGWVTLHDDGAVATWVVRGGALERTHDWPRGEPFSTGLAVCEATGQIATATQSGAIEIWAAEGGAKPRRLEGHERRVLSLACSSDGNRLVSGGFDGRVIVWNLGDPEGAPRRLREDGGAVYAVTFGSKDAVIVAAGGFGVTQWSASNGTPQVWSDRPHRNLVAGAGLQAGHGDDGTITVWRDDGTLLQQARTTGGRSVQGLSITPGGEALRLVGLTEAWQLPIDRTPLRGDAEALLATAEREAGLTSSDEGPDGG